MNMIFSIIIENVESRPGDMKKDLGFSVKTDLNIMTTTGTVVVKREGRKTLYSINPNYRPN